MTPDRYRYLPDAIRAACDWIVTPQSDNSRLSHLGETAVLYTAEGEEGWDKLTRFTVSESSFGKFKRGMLLIIDDQWGLITDDIEATVLATVAEYRGWPLLDKWNGVGLETGSWMFEAPVHPSLHEAVDRRYKRPNLEDAVPPVWPDTIIGAAPAPGTPPAVVRHVDEVAAAVKALRNWLADRGPVAQVDAGFRGTIENGQVVSTQGIGVVIPAELVMSILDELGATQLGHNVTI